MISIDKLVLLIIFLIALLVGLFVLFGMGSPMGEQILWQNELRQCCSLYRSINCPAIADIELTLECETDTLINLVNKLNMNTEQLKNFCYCKPQCSDGRDNDNDRLIDSADPQCHSDGDASNSNSYVAYDDDESS